MTWGAGLRHAFPDLDPRPDDLLLLEAHQVAALPSRAPMSELAAVLHAHPYIGGCLRARCPSISDWLAEIQAAHPPLEGADLASAEETLLWEIADEIVYQRAPGAYDQVARRDLDPAAVTGVLALDGRVVIDAGAGSGLVAFEVARRARTVYAVEPASGLRAFMRERARERGLRNVFVMDGLLSAIPLPDGVADVLVTCRAIGWDLAAELEEVERVVRPGGVALHLTGAPPAATGTGADPAADAEDALHRVLLAAGYGADVHVGASGSRRRYLKVRAG
jgi:SAM-dependent methyltransferase